ncbi:MAG: cbb3-type cytochrome oxidase assembly protein CcoS [Planctomycetota bacterium]
MSILFIALPVAIAMGAVAMWACIRSIRTGQFDDLQSPPIRILIDDESADPDEPVPTDDLDSNS